MSHSVFDVLAGWNSLPPLPPHSERVRHTRPDTIHGLWTCTQTRQKYLEERKKEKLEEQRARELVRVKLEEDRRRRRRKQGLPEELTAKEKAVLEEKRYGG